MAANRGARFAPGIAASSRRRAVAPSFVVLTL
jgi:hypothetical protein